MREFLTYLENILIERQLNVRKKLSTLFLWILDMHFLSFVVIVLKFDWINLKSWILSILVDSQSLEFCLCCIKLDQIFLFSYTYILSYSTYFSIIKVNVYLPSINKDCNSNKKNSNTRANVIAFKNESIYPVKKSIRVYFFHSVC